MEQPETLQNAEQSAPLPIVIVAPEQQQTPQIPVVHQQIEQPQFAQMQPLQRLPQHMQHYGHGMCAERFEPMAMERSPNQLQLPLLQFNREVQSPANSPRSVELPQTPAELQEPQNVCFFLHFLV